MNDFWYMSQHSAQRKQDFMAEAEESRLASISQDKRKRTIHVYGPVMFQVGSLLMRWGYQLQKQSGDKPMLPTNMTFVLQQGE